MRLSIGSLQPLSGHLLPQLPLVSSADVLLVCQVCGASAGHLANLLGVSGTIQHQLTSALHVSIYYLIEYQHVVCRRVYPCGGLCGMLS